MKNSVIRISEIEGNKEYLGSKTVNLKKCVDWGFNVPDFVALPSLIMGHLYSDNSFREEVARAAAEILGSGKYAVRSSALIEDGMVESFAGQFKTVLNVPANDLSGAIHEVIDQANNFLNGSLEKFSIIIQKYIDADISGIAFTRNPNGSREMVVEYGPGGGETIVGGKTRPERLCFYWEDQGYKFPKIIHRQIIERFKDLELKYDFPQDIEWCLTGSRFYLLQTRPITTISSKQYRQIVFLDGFLCGKRKFFYQKTEVSEIAPRPVNITADLLRAIYAQNGPVAKVYKKYGVAYKNTDFLKIIGNELFVDREKEVAGLLPACGYSGNGKLTARICRVRGLITTIRNIINLNRIKTGGYEMIFSRLKERIEGRGFDGVDIGRAVDNFLSDYEIVFEVNLMAGLSMKKAELSLKGGPSKLAEIMAGRFANDAVKKYEINAPKHIKGNSIEISDESDFFANEITNYEADLKNEGAQRAALDGKSQKEIMQGPITEAIICSRFREYGRWLAVKDIDQLRQLLLKFAEERKFADARNIYFSSLRDLLNGDASEFRCGENRKNYELFNDLNLPATLVSNLGIEENKITGISSGVACGILADRDSVARENADERNKILYAEVLSPDLVAYFDRIGGIAAANGGLLSHLAIIAREKGIPVVSGVILHDNNLKLGDPVRIDGGKGTISKCVL